MPNKLVSKANKAKTEEKKSIHTGHRERMQASVEKDPELDSFSYFQTLEYLLGFYIPRGDVNPLAHELIEKYGSLYGVFCANTLDLFNTKGMSKKAARFIPNMFSIIRKAELSRQERGPIVETVADGIEMLRPLFLGRNHERLYLLMLDVNDKVMNTCLISQGSANVTDIDIDTIILRVIQNQASKAMFAHNHPGGSLTPSNDDIKATASIAFILNTMGRELLDHVIFCGDQYFSFFENGLMDKMFKKSDIVFNSTRTKEVSQRLFANQYVFENGESTKGFKEKFSDKKSE